MGVSLCLSFGDFEFVGMIVFLAEPTSIIVCRLYTELHDGSVCAPYHTMKKLVSL